MWFLINTKVTNFIITQKKLYILYVEGVSKIEYIY